MFISFFESFKYLGHLWPIALLRVYMGYFFLHAGLQKVERDFMHNPVLQEIIQKWIQAGNQHLRYVEFLQTVVLPHWQVFSYLVITAEVAVGFCYIVGLAVRPAAVIATFLNLNFMLASDPQTATLNQVLIAVNVALFLVSAGRCLGMDYYFFKKIRGFWW